MPRLPDRLGPGTGTELGASWDGQGVNFALFSQHAERVRLCVFDRDGRRELARLDLPECTDGIWHGYLPGGMPGLVYGYRVDGPYEPRLGHRFNSNKLLLDPYAKTLAGTLRWSDALFGYRFGSPRADLTFDRRDSAPAMPKAVVVAEPAPLPRPGRKAHPWRDTVIYEAHVRGLTRLKQDLPEHERGSFAALGDPAVIDHLVALGITAVELMPMQAYIDDRFLVQKGLVNYWGYNTLGYFAPERRLLANGSSDEIRLAVNRLHAAGIEVILDVVFNHTCEGSELGPTLCFRGIDNASYYRLLPSDPRHYINDTGCGNTVSLDHPRVVQLVMDALRHWVLWYGIDGFRFDLAPVLGRRKDGYEPTAPLLTAIRQDPVLADVKLIAEPWDLGPGGYQLGNHPPGFAEWNDRFRDAVRRFWRGDEAIRPELAARLLGSADLFDRDRRRPWASVNFVASHDGFTLRDLVSYANRHNEANGEGGQDGHAHNHSASWGHEGESDDAALIARRLRVARAMLATVFLSQGTPMLLMGDEAWRSQGGNNNAYCQDNEIAWFDWSLLETPAGAAMKAFVMRLAVLRRAYPLLRSGRFLHGTEVLPGVADVAWLEPDGEPATPRGWHDTRRRALALRLAGPALVPQGIDILHLLLNPTAETMPFAVASPAGVALQCVLDTAGFPAGTAGVDAGFCNVPAHALILLAGRITVP